MIKLCIFTVEHGTLAFGSLLNLLWKLGQWWIIWAPKNGWIKLNMSKDKQRKREKHQKVQTNLDNLFNSIRIVEPCLNQIVSLSVFSLITLPLDLGVIPTYSFSAGTYQYLIFCFKQCRNYLTSFPCVPH